MAQPKRTQLRHFVPGLHCSMQWFHNSILARLCSEYLYIFIYKGYVFIYIYVSCISYVYIYMYTNPILYLAFVISIFIINIYIYTYNINQYIYIYVNIMNLPQFERHSTFRTSIQTIPINSISKRRLQLCMYICFHVHVQ